MMNRRALLGGFAATTAIALGGAGPVPAQNPVWHSQWPDTDFSRRTVDLSEILSGGVPKDGIPALDRAAFGGADGLSPDEAVITVTLSGEVPRAYPVRYLMWHEIVNDRIGDVPVAVTFCPLCNSALVFDRRVAGRTLSFGVSGNLRFSDMIMYDRQTESWWQQFTGEAIVGDMVGHRLDILVSWMEPLSAFLAANPDGPIMQEPRGFARSYGRNPYLGYDTSSRPFLYNGENPPHGIPPLMRVVRVGNRAWPLSRFEETPEISEAGVRISWSAGMSSSLDGPRVSGARDVGAIRVRDAESGRDLVHEVVFAFAFHAFAPDGIWMLGD